MTALSQVGQERPAEARQIGILTAPNSDISDVAAAVAAFATAKDVPLVVATHGGTLQHAGGALPVSRTYETGRSPGFDAIVVAGSPAAAKARIMVEEAFRHQKPIAVLPWGTDLLAPAAVPADAAGVFSGSSGASPARSLIDALAQHRVWDRAVAD